MMLILKFCISNTKKILTLFIALLFFSVLEAQDIKHKDSLLQELKSLKYSSIEKRESTEYVDLLNKLASLYRFRKPDSLNILSKSALEISEKINYQEGIIRSKIRQGDYFSDVLKPKIAEKIYSEIKNLPYTKDHPELIVDALKSSSSNYYQQGKLKQGIDHSYKAINIAKQNSLIETEAQLRHNLGYFYWSSELYEEAHSEYHIVDSLWQSLEDTLNLAITKSNIALNHLGLNELTKAKEYIDESIQVLSKGSNSLWQSRNYRVKSRYFIAKQDFDNALKFNKESDSLLNLLFNPGDKLQILENYVKIFYENGSLDQLQEYNLKMYTLAKELKNTKVIRAAYYYSKEVELQKNNFKQTVIYQKKIDSLDAKLEEHRRTNNLKFLRAKLEYDKSQIELRAENERKLARQTNTNRITIIALIISLLIGCLIVKYYYNQKKANKELKEINDTKDKIFSIIGHDLKTPLNTLNELLELFKQKALSSKEITELTPKIQTNVDYSTFTLNNLLCWAQSEMDGISTNPIEISIDEVIKETVAVFTVKSDRKNIQITNKIAQKINGNFDHEQLRIILRNLLCNAIKFSPSNGEIVINSEVEDENIKISICDNGKGYNPSNYQNLVNGKPTKSTRGTNNEKGTGLGLTICKELLGRNNSQMVIEPNKPTGSCFTVIIPR